jgi:uncharacterized ferritin-like protein (DUF455 family)
MDNAFLHELDSFVADRLAAIVGSGRASLGDAGGDARSLLQVALANEINVSELAALWMPTTRELDVKLAFARQAGDEAGHFQLVADRLRALGFDVDAFAPAENPLFAYLRGLATTIERLAAGLYALESLAYAVNETFIAYCDARGDAETARIYRDYIQPDERAHQQIGRRLLDKYATSDDVRALARATIARVFELAAAGRAKTAEKLGAACFPGC